MDMFKMKCFVSVVERGNVTAAAKEMFITQPSMTAKMDSLEKELGVRLLNRTARGATPTAAGKEAFEEFRRILAQMDEATERIRQTADSAYGRIRVGFHGPAQWAGVFQLVKSYMSEREHADVRIVIEDWCVLADMLMTDKLDIAFLELTEVEGNPHLESVFLFEDPLCAVMSTDQDLAQRDEVVTKDLEPYRLITPDYSFSPKFFKALRSKFANSGARIRGAGAGNYSEATIALTLAGLGVAIMPKSLVPSIDGIRAVPLADQDMTARMGIAWLKRSNEPSLDSFIEHCKAASWPIAS